MVDAASVSLRDRIELHDRRKGELFSVHGIEAELDRAIQRKVWLKSGGYLIIDETEAFTVFDINTGRYVGSTSLAQTVLDTNLEAAAEIARQLRLRDIGGIVVIDFIDMDITEHRQKVIACLEEHLKRDRTRSHVLGLTQLGLVEMTRKKVKQSLGDMMTKICPICEGRGRILSAETVAARVRREMREILRNSDSQGLLIEVHPDVASLLIGTGGSRVREMEKELGKAVYIRGAEEHSPEGYKFRLLESRAEAQAVAAPVQVGDIIELRVEDHHSANRKDGVARVDGFVMDIEDGGDRVGERVRVEVTRVHKTHARSRIIGPERPDRGEQPGSAEQPGPIDELHDARRRESAVLAAMAKRTPGQAHGAAAATEHNGKAKAAAGKQDGIEPGETAAKAGRSRQAGQAGKAASAETAQGTAAAGTTGNASARSRSRRRRPRKPAAATAAGQGADTTAAGQGADTTEAATAATAAGEVGDAQRGEGAAPAGDGKHAAERGKPGATQALKAEAETAAATDGKARPAADADGDMIPNGEAAGAKAEQNGDKPKRKPRRRRSSRRRKPHTEETPQAASAAAPDESVAEPGTPAVTVREPETPIVPPPAAPAASRPGRPTGAPFTLPGAAVSPAPAPVTVPEPKPAVSSVDQQANEEAEAPRRSSRRACAAGSARLLPSS